jgi:hypothetical protein
MPMAQAKIDDLHRQAGKARLASQARAATRAGVPAARALADGSVTLRPRRAEDRVSLARLAALDGARRDVTS